MSAPVVRAVPIADIKIGARLREDMGDIAGLAASLAELGQLMPILIDQDHNLLNGARRLAAAKLLGWTQIEARVKAVPARTAA